MMINRYNYEEYFLLYVDNELPVSDRATVELSVQQNPDLASELKIMEQAKLPGEEVVIFENKQVLYKKESAGINMQNYEEYFLLYIDNELKDADKKAVEKFVLQHPQLQTEFTLLNRTILEPEIIAFSDKGSLYRREERRIIPVMWRRIAAAAAFIGLVFMTWRLIPSTENTRIASVKPDNQKAELSNTNNIVAQNPVQSQADAVATDGPSQRKDLKKNTEEKLNQKRMDQKENLVKNNTQPGKNDELADNQQNNTPPIKNNPEDNIDNNTSIQSTDIAVTKIDQPADVPVSKHTDIEPSSDIIAFQNTNITGSSYHSDNTIFQPVVYKDLNINDDDRSINVGSMQLNKNKLKGLLRKAGRLISGKGKNNTNNDGKLQVANLEIKTN